MDENNPEKKDWLLTMLGLPTPTLNCFNHRMHDAIASIMANDAMRDLNTVTTTLLYTTAAVFTYVFRQLIRTHKYMLSFYGKFWKCQSC